MTCLLAMSERRENAYCGVKPRDDVHEGDADLGGGAGLRPGDAHEPSDGLNQHVVAGQLGATVDAEAADRAVDNTLVDPTQIFVAEPEFGQCPGPEVFDDHVCAGREV